MPIVIKNKVNCTGCGACMNVCPKDCISMCADYTGFEYPQVDLENCISCEKCVKTCPIISPDSVLKNNAVSVNAAWSLNKTLRFNSTSGGIFSEIAYEMIDREGAVVGAVYDENNTIKHAIVFSNDGIEKLRQSKYAQSNTEDIYRVIKETLPYKKVLFCGSPCQVAGLKKYLGDNQENLYTMDFICRGVNSPKAYKAWLSEIEYNHRSKVTRVWFKYKVDGWKKSPRCTRIDLENGKYLIQKGELNPYMFGYLGPNLFIRPSCSDCKFKGYARHSDITVGDFWKIDKALDDDQGTSMVQINSEKGARLFDSISERIVTVECYKEDIQRGNAMMDDSVKINPNSEDFLKSLGPHNFTRMVEKYSKRDFKSKIKYTIKKALHKIGLYE